MRQNGFTFIEVLISLSLLGMITLFSFAAQQEYQLLQIQAQHFQEQQAQFIQLREIIERYAPEARNKHCSACAVILAATQWSKHLPSYMTGTPTLSSSNQLMVTLCSAKPTTCIEEKIVV